MHTHHNFTDAGLRPTTHLRLALAVALCTVAAGTVGYRVIEGWTWLESAWMVLITVTTIGYGELRPLSDAGRVFTMVFILCGLSVATYAAAQTTRYLLEGDLLRDLRAEWRNRRMSGLSNHFIVAGFGRLGREVTEELMHAGHPVVVIDVDGEAVEYARLIGATWLRGDASNDEVLEEAGVRRARGLAVATSSDALNVLITLSAKQLKPELLIYTRVDDKQTASKAKLAGADHVINPYERGGTAMAVGMLRPHTRDFMELAVSRSHAELAMEDVRIAEGSGCTGLLRDLDLPSRYRVMVVAVRRPGAPLNPVPAAATALEVGDVLVVVGRPEDILAFSARVGSS